ESLSPAREHLFADWRQRASFLLNLTGKRPHTNCIHDLEWAEFPGEAPAQRTINIHNVVGNFRHAAGCVQTHFGKSAPQELLGFIPLLPFQQGPDKRAQALPRVLDCLAHFEGSESGFLSRAVLHSVYIESQNLFVAFAFHFFVTTLAGLLPDPPAPGHLFSQSWNFIRFA